MEMIIAIFAGIFALSIITIIFIALFGVIRYLIQNYLLYRIGQKTNLDIPVVSFIPFGSFYVAGQMWDGAVFPRNRFIPVQIGLVMTIIAVVLWLMGLSIGDLVISYLVMESIALFGVFNTYFKDNKVLSGIVSIINPLFFGIPALIVLYLFNQELNRAMYSPINTNRVE